MIGTISRKNCLTFGGDPVPDTDSGSLFRFPFINPPSPLQNRRFSGYLLALAFLIQSPALTFTILDEMTDADKRMNPPHFGSDPADTGSGFESRIKFD